jgi:hypothetical protein
MPSNWLAFDRIRALAKQYRIYQAERTYQDQPSLDRLTAGGDFLDMNQQAAILDQTNLQINRLERYKDYEQMDQTGEISLALDLYADEACLTGDTRIPLLDGSCPTIAELADRGIDNEFWVYSVDPKTGSYVPALARGARISGKNIPVVRVILDDGSDIKCTSDHLFMTKAGNYRQAGDLRPGDSLKPLYRKKRYRAKGGSTLFDDKPYPTATAYEYFFNGNNFTSTHRWIYHHLNNDNPQVVHHKDFNSLNNCPTNLIGMTTVEHDAIHKKYGVDNHSYNCISMGEINQKMEGWSGPVTIDGVCGACDIGERVLRRVLTANGLTWNNFRDAHHRCSCCDNRITGKARVCRSCRQKYLHDYHQRRKNETAYRDVRKANKRAAYVPVAERLCSACDQVKPANEFCKNGAAYSPYCNDCRPITCESRYLKKSFANHKVVAVEPCGIAETVYDIEVPGYNCFAAGTESSWVIVHNSLVDPERKHTLIIRARNRRLKRELEDLFFNTLRWDTYQRPTTRYLCKYGDAPFEIILDANREGVSALKFMNVYNFTRIETRYGDLVGFFYMDAMYPKPQFLHPWQVMHMRLTSFENIYHPYGRAVLDGGRKAFKQLRLMEDAALIYRITRAPEKRKFFIPVGMIPPKEVPEYMQMLARNFKRQRFYNPTTGAFDERYSPLIQEDDFFLPKRPDGSGPDIDVLPGAENLDQIADIEYFKKKMIAPLKIPFARVGIGEGGGEASEKSLSQSHSEFAKAVQWIQREEAAQLTKVAIVHLALRGYRVEDLRGFELALTATSAMEELYRIETWQTRVGVMTDLKELGWFPKEWIVTHFTDLSPDEIEELEEMELYAMTPETAEDEEGGGGGGGGGLGLGGAPGGLEGGDDLLGDLGGEEAGDEEDTKPEAAPPMEGLDIKAQKRLIREEKIRANRKEAKRIVEKWHGKIGKSNDEIVINSGFDHLLAQKELDGLSSSSNEVETGSDGTILEDLDQKMDKGLIVEWSVPKDERDEAIREVYQVLVSGSDARDVDESDITLDDLPTRVSDL